MSENNSIDIPERKEEDLDYTEKPDVIQPEIMKPKRTRKPMSEENKQKMRESMARARIVREANAKNKAEINNKFKEKVHTIENLDAVIERKITEKIPIKEPKPTKNKEEKTKKKKQLIETIINDTLNEKLNDKLKLYKPVKPKLSDFQLIQRLF
jgi:hypothetical protein